jgi:hypothetical protein
MKKLAVGLALTASIILLLAAPSSASSFSVVGGGTAGTLQFAVSALQRPDGASDVAASGHVVLRDSALGEVQGSVICLRETSPGQAVFWIQKTRGSGLLGSQNFVGIFAADFSFGDVLAVGSLSSTPSSSCVLDAIGVAGGPVTRGNISIR